MKPGQKLFTDEQIAEILGGLEEDLLPKPKVSAEIVQWPKPLSEQELWRRQRIIDQVWERVQAEKRELEAEVGFHVGPGDRDYHR